MKRKFKVVFYLTLAARHEDENGIDAGPVLCRDVKEHIRDAVQSWGGQKHPSDVFFGMQDDQLTKLKVYNAD